MKQLSVLGILVAVALLGFATTRLPGGYDWNRDYFSSLLREPAGPARPPGVAGLLTFCVSIALVFARLARTAEFSRSSSLIRIGGIGSMVYDGLTFTPMHDLMVKISIVFFLAAVVPLTRELYACGEKPFAIAGTLCIVVLIGSVIIYYGGVYVSVLPWAQRLLFAAFAIWLLCLDRAFPRADRRRIGSA